MAIVIFFREKKKKRIDLSKKNWKNRQSASSPVRVSILSTSGQRSVIQQSVEHAKFERADFFLSFYTQFFFGYKTF